MDECLEEIKKGNKILRIYNEDSPQDPRCLDYDEGNLSFMVCFHNNYNLGDSMPSINKDSFDNWDELGECLVKDFKAINLMPLFLYDHSGITISNKPFGCRWDSGQIGFIYTTKKRLKELGIKLKKLDIDKRIKMELKVYDNYLTGEVYGFTLNEIKTYDSVKTYTDGTKIKTKDNTEEEEINSCWGFYGDDGIKQIKEDNGFLE